MMMLSILGWGMGLYLVLINFIVCELRVYQRKSYFISCSVKWKSFATKRTVLIVNEQNKFSTFSLFVFNLPLAKRKKSGCNSKHF